MLKNEKGKNIKKEKSKIIKIVKTVLNKQGRKRYNVYL